MFRFTIRELVLLTLVAAMGVGWWMERGRSQRNDQAMRKLEAEVQLSRSVIKSLSEDISRIDQDLSKRGLKLVWSNDMRPSVGEYPPDR
ncbi:MAG: hypothetical protein L0211_09425 [Planctomycetaceae bacterium]|nr:hypothetical protein [Planctomycetaceae bacterium]